MDACDFLVIGSGPAGQKAAIQGAKAGLDVVLVESEPKLGGICVHKGTIPSKALRESALRFKNARRLLKSELPTELAALMQNVEAVVNAHDNYISAQISRSQIRRIQGKARFVSTHEVEVFKAGGDPKYFHAEKIFVATGSQPRHPYNVKVDHEYILDSDSILSMNYLPHSLIVVGGGVIACEYASVFLSLGTEVTLIDKFDLPLGFLDEDLAQRFITEFKSKGGKFLGKSSIKQAAFDEISSVNVTLENGCQMSAEKLLVAQGRISCVEGLDIDKAGVDVTDMKLISVNKNCQTNVPHIYAVGDVIGPPSLASSSMEQGHRAACHALGNERNGLDHIIPIGIYAIPELASVGLSEAAARHEFVEPIIGYAEFKEVARGLIAGSEDGMLKMIAHPDGNRLLGVHIVGEGAAELIHVGQMALASGSGIDTFVDQIFNFPTLAEAYRVAALNIQDQVLQNEGLEFPEKLNTSMV